MGSRLDVHSVLASFATLRSAGSSQSYVFDMGAFVRVPWWTYRKARGMFIIVCTSDVLIIS